MAITEMLFWWYSHGWQVFINKTRNGFSSVTDFFSMDSLIRTLFKPYRQISAGTSSSDASIELKLHMFLDRLVSRFIGFASRLILLIVGTVIIILVGIGSLVLIVLWPLIPLIPVAGIVLSVMGVLL